MQHVQLITTNLKEFAGWCGFKDSEDLVDLLEDFPDLNLWRRRKHVKRYRTLIHSDVEKLKSLLPESKRKELSL